MSMPFGAHFWDAFEKDARIKSIPNPDDPYLERMVGHKPHPMLSPRCLRFSDDLIRIFHDRHREPGFFLAEWRQPDSFTSEPVQDRVVHQHITLGDIQRRYNLACESGNAAHFIEAELPAILDQVSCCARKLEADIEAAEAILKTRAQDRTKTAKGLKSREEAHIEKHEAFSASYFEQLGRIQGSLWWGAVKKAKIKRLEAALRPQAEQFAERKKELELSINLFNWESIDSELMQQAVKSARVQLERDKDILEIRLPDGRLARDYVAKAAWRAELVNEACNEMHEETESEDSKEKGEVPN